jgi:hypothetical protein
MKKLVCLLFILVLCTGSALAIVDSTSTPLWKVGADNAAQFYFRNNDLTRGMALNKVTNHLLVATRTITHRIVVLNAATGDSVGQLDMTGVTGGTYPLNKVGAADDGVIYACNLNTGSGLKIYRWANESAVPVIAADTTMAGITRYGDAFAVVGQGRATKLFIAGNNTASRITILGTTDGVRFRVEKMIPKNGQCTDIFPVDSNTFWVKRPGIAATRLDGNGEITGTVPTSVIGTSAAALAQFGYAGYWYLAGADGNVTPATGRLVQLGDDLAAAQVNVVYKGMGSNKNTNGVGAVVVQPDSDRIWLLTTNNAIAMYSFGGYASFPLAWRSRADTAAWHGAGDKARAFAYSRKTRHLYIASQAGGSSLKAFDAATGAFVRDLDTGLLAGGADPVNMVTATVDGQIFAATLAQANGSFKLYRYRSENAAPVLVWQGIVPARTGDVLACAGTGEDVTVFASGRGHDRIYTFVQIGGTLFARGADIPLPEADAAGMGLAPVGDGSYLFITAPGKPVRYIKNDGTLLYQFDDAEAAGAAVDFEEIPALDGSTRRFLFLTSGPVPGVSVYELFGEDGDNLCVYWEKWPAATPAFSQNANPSALSGSVYDLYSNQLIELAVNNGLSAYSFANIMPNAGALAADPLFSADYLDFGAAVAGTQPQLSFTIVNQGKIHFVIYSAEFDGDRFTSDLTAPATVEEDDTLTVTITLHAESPGDFDDALSLVTNAGLYEIQVYAVVDELWPLAWRQTADTTAWLGTEGKAASLVYNKATGHLLAVSRAGGNVIVVLDPANGRAIRNLNSAGIDGGTFAIHRIAVSDDGQIFVGNLAAAGANFKLYYLADEEAAPVMVFDGQLDGRVGDALGVSGEGGEVVVYASGADNARIFTFKTDGITFGRGEDILLPEAGAAGNAISPADADHLFVGGVGTPVRYLNREGAVLFEFDDALFGGTTCSYFAAVTDAEVTRRFVAACAGFTPGTRVVELHGAAGEHLCDSFSILPVATPAYSAVPNADATGQVAYDRVGNQLIELVTNNGISAYSFARVVADPKPYVIVTTIAAAKVDLNGDYKPDLAGQTVTIEGVVTTLNYNTGNSSSYYLQDERGWGINFYSSKINYKLEAGDLVRITGKIEFYSGLTEITATDSAAVQKLARVVPPAPRDIASGAELNERTEGSLVRLTGYYLAVPATWPGSGKNATLQFIRGADTVLVFIDKETDIDGSPVPQGYYVLTGVVDQYTTSVPPNNKYEIRPRSLADLTQATGVATGGGELPVAFALRQNYPNPFNPVTTVGFEAPAGGEVKLKVYDLLGKEVATIFEGRLEAGFHTFRFDGSSLSSGIYFYRVEAGAFTELKKMTLVK